jgi:hypothetical protein
MIRPELTYYEYLCLRPCTIACCATSGGRNHVTCITVQSARRLLILLSRAAPRTMKIGARLHFRVTNRDVA